MIYVFMRRFHTLDEVDAITQEKAHELAENDIIGAVLEYETLKDFATDFNHGCFSHGRYIIKSFEP